MITKILTLTKNKKDNKIGKEYVFTGKEAVLYLCQGIIVLGIISALFYQSILAFFVLLPLLYFYMREKQKDLCGRRKKELSKQFRELIMAVASNLQAGYCVENAFCEAYPDMIMLYGREGLIVKELHRMIQKLHNNEALEDILQDFAVRSDVEDIREFAEVFRIVRRSGGDIRNIITNTANIIGEKIQVRQDMEIVISDKKFEQRIMSILPFLMILYISLTSKGYFDSLYHNLCGVLIMTGCLIAYYASNRLAKHILTVAI